MDIPFAFLLTLIAGLSTSIGSVIAYIIKKPKLSYLAFGLGFSAGVMIYVSFGEMLPHGQSIIGPILGTLLFFLGTLIMGLLDLLFPEPVNPHHVHNGSDAQLWAHTNNPNCPPDLESLADPKGDTPIQGCEEHAPKLLKMGLMTAVTIAIHNFPEGIAVFGTTIYDARLGLLIMIAIAVHNIPEGIAVSMPIYYATSNRKKAFLLSFASGLTEPLGAALGYLILLPFLSETLIGGLLCVIAGVMIYISIDELIPVAHKYGRGHIVIIGLILGMFVMAATLLFV